MDWIKLAQAAVAAGSAGIGWWKGRKEDKDLEANPTIDIETMTPEQKQLIDTLNKLGGEGAERQAPFFMGDQYEGFKPIAGYERDIFNQRTMPEIAEQLHSFGGASADTATGFHELLRRAQEDFELGLGQKEEQFGSQRLGQQQNFLSLLSGQGLQKSLEPTYRQPGDSGMGKLLGQIASAGISEGTPYFMNKFNNRGKA